jgi:hypothetical protein
VPVVFPLRIGGVFHVKSCVSAVIDFVLLHIPYVVHNNIDDQFPEGRTANHGQNKFVPSYA